MNVIDRFWRNFRNLCLELQSQIEILLHWEGGGAADGGGIANKYDTAKAYYSTATRRSEGRIQLDCILENVRLLRRHCLSSSSMLPTSKNNDDDDVVNPLLSTLLSTPMPEMTQTDIRILSEEMDRLLKCIDEARMIISPKEKFVFRRYRKAMEEQRLLLGENVSLVGDGAAESAVSGLEESSKLDTDDNTRKGTNDDEQPARETFHHDGGVLENKRDCTIEIFPNGNIQVNQVTQTQLQYYSLPRRINSLHPPSYAQKHDTTTTTSTSLGSMSYLLQNLTNVTILLHGSRPSLHIKNIHNCQIYVTEPTLGPVHMTNCHSSKIRCSCYQLRIHDSINVTLDVWVRSGPIIENCRGMVFEGNYYAGDDTNKSSGGGGSNSVEEKNMYWDVKDFNWLRTLRKSPNFVVVTTDGSSGEEVDGGKDETIVSDEEGVGRTMSVSVQDDTLPLQEEEEDSDDEL